MAAGSGRANRRRLRAPGWPGTGRQGERTPLEYQALIVDSRRQVSAQGRFFVSGRLRGTGRRLGRFGPLGGNIFYPGAC